MVHARHRRQLLRCSIVLAFSLFGCSSEPPPDPVVVARTDHWPPGTVLTFEAEMESEPLEVRVTRGGETTNRSLTFRQREEVEVTVGSSQLLVKIPWHGLDVAVDGGEEVSFRHGTEGRTLTVQRDSRGRPLVLGGGGGETYGFTGMERFVSLLDAEDGYSTLPIGRGEPGEVVETGVDPMLGGLVNLDYGAASVELVGMETREGMSGAALSTYHVLSGYVFGRQRRLGSPLPRVRVEADDLLADGGVLSRLRSQMELRGDLFRALDPLPHDAEYTYSGDIELSGDVEHQGQSYNVRIEGPVTVRGGVRVR